MADEKVTATDADTTATTTEPNIPVQTSAPEPLIVATEEPETATETEVETQAEPVATEQAKKPEKVPEWLQKKLNEAAYSEREAKRRAKEAEDKLTALTAPKPTADDTRAAEAAAPQGGYKTQAEFNDAVQAETAKRASEDHARAEQAAFDARCNAAYTAGKTTFAGDFDTAVANLQSAGAMSKDMLDLVLETNDPAKVLYELGSDPERASSLMAMTPTKRAVEIGKMSVAAPVTKEPTKLSAAPRPIVPVEGSARVSGEPRDDDPDDVWFAKRNAEVRKRVTG